MKLVERSELLALGAYEQVRDRFRQRVIDLKKRRRIALGPHMSLVFENHDTMLLQVQEMLRTERITDERAIAHELETYNELIPGPGAVSGTLFIEYDDPVQRRDMLQRFSSLRTQMQLTLGDAQATGRFATHFGEEMDRLPAVNYVAFELGQELGKERAAAMLDPGVPAALVVTHPDYPVRVELPRALREELAADLG